MNKQMSAAEIDELGYCLLSDKPPVMTRQEKLLRFAELVRTTPNQFVIFSNLEHYYPHQWDGIRMDHSAFAMAALDPVFRNAGLRDDTVGSAVRFFELSRDELHAFSCDCGGIITNDFMAARIEKIAQDSR
jgi:hypothetical protein